MVSSNFAPDIVIRQGNTNSNSLEADLVQSHFEADLTIFTQGLVTQNRVATIRLIPLTFCLYIAVANYYCLSLRNLKSEWTLVFLLQLLNDLVLLSYRRHQLRYSLLLFVGRT